jgi:hypothetical protein
VPELPVLPRRGDLAQHVLVDVALGIAVLHGHGVQQVHHLRQQPRRRDGEAGVLHVLRVGGVVAAQRAQKRKDVLRDHGVHVRRSEVLEARPAEVVVRPVPGVRAFGKHTARHRLTQLGGLALLQRVQLVQPLQKEQIGDLFDDL